MKSKKNLLFLCKHNVFRSKVAEAYFKKINKNKNIHAESAGFIKANLLDGSDMRAIRSQKESLEKRGILLKFKSRALGIKLLKKQDLIVIVANDLSNIFNEHYVKKGLKVKIWKIEDVDVNSHNQNKLDFIIESIFRKVEDLVRELK